jgi:SNF2 family DNA or RNA helicase
MIVLQGAVRNGAFVLWGESPAVTTKRPTAKKKASVAVRPSPFDAGGERLIEAVAEGVAGLALLPSKADEWVVWLPSTSDGPAPSSPLVAEPPDPKGAVSLEPWRVAGLSLPIATAVDVLAACIGRTTLAAGLIVGATLDYWASALQTAGSLVARQQYLPGLVPVTGGFRARWEPVALGADAARLTALASAMPPACRALVRNGEPAPVVAAADILREFLHAAVDHLVRASQLTHEKMPARFASVHDAWLHALKAPDSLIKASAAELAKLDEQVRTWRRPISLLADAPARLCFRLEEPAVRDEDGAAFAVKVDDGAEQWNVRYLLQAADDPSLIVPVADVWNPRKRKAAAFREARPGFEPREYLMAALGQAAALCPGVEPSLKTVTPEGFALDSSGANEFLNLHAAALEDAGFGVHLPAWWTRKGTKQKLSARAVVRSSKLSSHSGFSIEDIFKFRWQVALGDHTLTLDELKALARLKSPLVRIRGQWVQLSAEEIQAALEFWKTKSEGTLTAREIVHMALGAGQPPGGLQFAGVEADGKVEELLTSLRSGSGIAALTPPEGLRGTLRPYQARGYSWLDFLTRWGFGACLADDMGLGKTLQTLTLLQHRWEAAPPRGRKPALLVCPTSVVGNWAREAAKFTPNLPVHVHHGLDRTKGREFKAQARKQALVLTSYALLHRDQETFAAVDWSGVVLDEAQNIKNAETKQSKAARSLKAGFRVALTGTPVENHVGDLWSIVEFLNPGWLGTRAEFKRSFHVPIQVNDDAEAAARLKKLTGPFILRRLKTDKTVIADLPDKLEMNEFCTLTREQASLYTAVVDAAAEDLEEADGIKRRGVVLATLTKLKQVCNHPAQFLGDNSSVAGRSGKLSRLTEMLEEALDAGDRALIFTQFAEMGAILVRHLEETFGEVVPFLHGAVPKARRDGLVDAFQNSGEHGPRLFILSLKAGGTGLNLTRANRVFHYDRWWNPAVENQATDRAFRIGQTRSVQVHKFVCSGTMEEAIDAMISRKKEVAGRTVGTGENWLTELSTKELQGLIALRREALEGD